MIPFLVWIDNILPNHFYFVLVSKFTNSLPIIVSIYYIDYLYLCVCLVWCGVEIMLKFQISEEMGDSPERGGIKNMCSEIQTLRFIFHFKINGKYFGTLLLYFRNNELMFAGILSFLLFFT